MKKRLETQLGREETHIENIAKGDISLLVMPHMLKEHEDRYRLIASVLKEIGTENKPTIVDMGSARDLGVNILTKEVDGAKVIGLEKGRQYIKRAMQDDQNVVHHAQADTRNTPLPNECADAVAIIEMLEHVPEDDQPKLLDEAFRITKKGGLVFVSTPLPYSFDENGDRVGASSNPFHLYEPTTDEVIQLATNAGFEIVNRYGQSFASDRGINLAHKLEKFLSKFKIPAWTIYGINLNFIRDPKPTIITGTGNQKDKQPLTQIFILRKPVN